MAAASSLLVVAGDASGDQHGAELSRALQARLPHVHLYGIGGAAMRAAGVETLFDTAALNVVGLVEAGRKLLPGLRMARGLVREAQRRRTPVAVLIDAPGFNLPLACRLRRAGVRVVYYVSPQVWAWRRRRVHTLARCVDLMLTLFPFEVPFYRAAGVHAVCVGHPLLDRIASLPPPEAARVQLGLGPARPTVALLPGSRDHEVRRLLPPLRAAFCHLAAHLPEVQGVLPLAPTLNRQALSSLLASLPAAVKVVEGQSLLALRAAHYAMVASGTATLEAALLQVPMVVVYRLHPLTALLARLLVRVPYISLVNLILGQPVVPELLQRRVKPRTLAALALRFLTQPAEAARLRAALAAVRPALGEPGAAQRAAAHVQAFLTSPAAAATLNQGPTR